MECPKCGLEIDDKATVCPNCKKVLKLICPICKALNETNTCRKCGYVIITKCHKCGKINRTYDKKCRACGFNLERSVILNESNTDDFVILTIDFPNLNEMKDLLGGSIQLFNKFKLNIDNLIANFAKSAMLRRQLYGNTYVIRFNRAYNFNSSAKEAVSSAIGILNKITTMNAKLARRKNVSVRCNMFLLKRDVNSDPDDHKAALNISLLELDAKNKEDKILNTFQVLTDPDVHSVLEKDYPLEPLNAVMTGDEMTMYYELNLKNLVKPEFEPEHEKDQDISEFVKQLLYGQDKADWQELDKTDLHHDPDDIYDIETINFEEIKCDFQRVENIDVFERVTKKLKAVPKGILAIKTAPLYKPYSLKLISEIYDLGLYNNVITITCHDDMKYSPYSFFREFIATIFEYTVSQKLFSHNDFSMFNSIDPDGLIEDLTALREREVGEDTRYVYFDIFMTLLQVIPNTLIFIEDFEKIDDSSYEAVQHLFGAFESFDVSWLLSYNNKEFSLHKKSYYLLTQSYYTEISLKPTSAGRLIEDNKDYYKNILDNFYFHRVVKYSAGSILFVDIALQYLIESDIFTVTTDGIEAAAPKTIIIPSGLNGLLKRRFDLMKDDRQTFEFLVSVVLLGTRVDMETINSLGFEKPDEIIEKLTDMGYVYLYNNCLYFPNYNLVRGNLIQSAGKSVLKEIAGGLFEKVFDDAMPSPMKAYFYELLDNSHEEREQWEEIARVSLSMGDFSAYLNSTDKIIQILDKETDSELTHAAQEYKLELYQNISANLDVYDPEKNKDIAMPVLNSLINSADTDSILMLCNKMIQGCLISGNYAQAQELTHRVLSLLPAYSLDPAAKNFNHYFFLMQLVHIQILFNTGALDECLDLGAKALGVVTNDTLEALKPDDFETEHFKKIIIDALGYVALANVLALRGNVHELLNLIRGQIDGIPETFNIFVVFQDFIHGNLPEIEPFEPHEDDKFSGALFCITDAFVSHSNNPTDFAQRIYQAKNYARMNELHQIELFCDLLIGYTYMNLKSYNKAEAIFSELAKTAVQNELLFCAVQYFTGEFNLRLGKYDAAYGIISNSLIRLEKNNTLSEYLLLLFKYGMFKILMLEERFETAEICLNQAVHIAQKYGINFAFDVNAWVRGEELGVSEALAPSPESEEQ